MIRQTLFTRLVRNIKLQYFRMASTTGLVKLDQIRTEMKKFDGGSVTLSKDETNGIAFICIDHPTKKNGLSGKMMVDLNDAVINLEGWTTGKGLIVYGKGDIFCSGGYLETVKQICSPEGGCMMSTLMHDTTKRLRGLPLFSVSIIQGLALGGGAELTLATDSRLMTETAEIAFVQGMMGVATGWGGGKLLTKLIGRSKALDLLLTCRKISSIEALKLGLVDEIMSETAGIDEETRIKFAIKWLNKRVIHHDSSIVQIIKQIVHCEDSEEEKLAFVKLWGNSNHLKSLAQNVKHK